MLLDIGSLDSMSLDGTIPNVMEMDSTPVAVKSGRNIDDLVNAIMSQTGRTKASWQYLQSYADEVADDVADNTAADDTADNAGSVRNIPGDSALSPLPPVHSMLNMDQDKITIHHPIHSNILLGISTATLIKSYVVTACLQTGFQLIPFLFYLKRVRPSIRRILEKLELQNQDCFIVASGHSPMRVEEPGSDTMTKLSEICSFRNVQDLMERPETTACTQGISQCTDVAGLAEFTARYGLDSSWPVYAVYIFDPRVRVCPNHLVCLTYVVWIT